MTVLTLLPAIDVSNGLSVRVSQGTPGSETAYGDPLEIAHSFIDQGAEWLHLVDLDAAFGRGNNADVLTRVIAGVSAKVSIELSGGIRDEDTLARALDTGVRRVNLSTAALDNIEWVFDAIRRHGDRIAVGLDIEGTVLAARGSESIGGNLFEILSQCDAKGAARYVITDVTKDGMMKGPNVPLLQQVSSRTPTPLIASGGIASLNDIAAIRDLVPLGVEALILGKALYEGVFTLTEALTVAQEGLPQ